VQQPRQGYSQHLLLHVCLLSRAPQRPIAQSALSDKLCVVHHLMKRPRTRDADARPCRTVALRPVIFLVHLTSPRQYLLWSDNQKEPTPCREQFPTHDRL
jgi:hypothetical protein